jgi:hypothetical protein
LFLFFLQTLSAQSKEGSIARSVSFYQTGKSVQIDYRIPAPASVYVYVSLDAAKTFQGPLQMVSGDVGIVATKGTKTILWNPLEEIGEIVSNQVCFMVMAIPIDVAGRPEEKTPETPAKGSSVQLYTDVFGAYLNRISGSGQSGPYLGFTLGASLSLLFGGPNIYYGFGLSGHAIPCMSSTSTTESSVTIRNTYYYNDWFPCAFGDLRYFFRAKSRPYLKLQAGGGYYWSPEMGESFLSPYASLGVGIHPLKHLSLQFSADYFQAREASVVCPTVHLGLSF